MNQKQQQKIESKERILNVASRLFKKNGFSATGIDEIMAEAGLTAGGFYAHFKSKTDLLEQAIEHSMKHSRELLLKGTEHLHGYEKINAVLGRYTSSFHRDLPEKGCILPALAAEIHRGTKKSNEIIGRYIERWAQMLSAYMPDPVSAEEKKQKALSMISAAVGAVLLSRMVQKTGLSDEILKAAKKKTGV